MSAAVNEETTAMDHENRVMILEEGFAS